MTKTNQITFRRCVITDDTIAESLCPQEEDPRIAHDQADRLSAFTCERCQTLVDHMLTMEAGQAVCDGCIREAFDD